MRSSIPIFLLLVSGLGLVVADFRHDALVVINNFRARHGAPPLVQDHEANNFAQAYAEKLAREGKFEHSGNRKYGENLAWFGGSNKSPSKAAVDAVKMWYSEEPKYDYNNPNFSMQTGHFSALVWKNTRGQGIGVASNHAKGSTVVVASYSPPGNFMGQFGDNVGRPQWG